MADTRESFVSFWRYVASTFSGSNGVFGYELMNEPWAGNVVADLSLMLPGVAGRRNLAPLYERVSGMFSRIKLKFKWKILPKRRLGRPGCVNYHNFSDTVHARTTRFRLTLPSEKWTTRHSFSTRG